MINKVMVTRAVISKIEEDKKPKEIKAQHIVGYDNPDKIAIKGKAEGYTPDIAAVSDHETSIYEIELERNISIDKWRTFSLYARKKNGNLFLVVPDYMKETVKKEITDSKIKAGVIFFDTHNGA